MFTSTLSTRVEIIIILTKATICRGRLSIKLMSYTVTEMLFSPRLTASNSKIYINPGPLDMEKKNLQGIFCISP